MKGLSLKLTSNAIVALSLHWSSNPQLPNGSYLINQQVSISVLICGMGPKRTTEFLELLDVGTLSRETIRIACNSFHSFVKTERVCSIDRAIKYCNNYQLNSKI
jgi:hypothetical protein